MLVAVASLPTANLPHCLLMDVAYFLADFVTGRCFCIEHIDRPYDIVPNTFEIIYFICRRISLSIEALSTYQFQAIYTKNRIVKHLPLFWGKSPCHDDGLLSEDVA